MSTAEAHIRALCAPLFENNDGLTFFSTAFAPHVKWTVNNPISNSSHRLTGVYEGIEAVGQLFWQLENLFLIEGKDMRSELQDVVAQDDKAAIRIITRGKVKKTGKLVEDFGCWLVKLESPGGKIVEVFSYSDSALLLAAQD